jgi:hypothetical protein
MREREPQCEPPGDAVDVEGWTLAWGNSTAWKAHWRKERIRRHVERPLAERLRAALSLVLPRSSRDRTRP